MKKIVTLALVAVLATGLMACGKEETDNNQAPVESNQPTNTDDNSVISEDEIFGTADVSLEELKNAVVGVLGENYWPNTQIPAEMLEGTYGINADMYDEYLGEMPMISTNVDTLLIIKAKDGQVEAVEAALNAYRDAQVEDTMQYPMNVGKVQASRIETFGNYVCFVQLGADTMELSEQGDEVVIEHCQQENEKALDAIEKTLAQ